MSEKHLWKSDILSKDAVHRPTSLLKISLFHRCFQTLASKNQLPDFYISGTLVENGLSSQREGINEDHYFSATQRKNI